MSVDKYRRDGTPYPAGNEGLFAWAKDLNRLDYVIVKQETLPNGYWISTVWLGLDHNYWDEGPPLFFETMVKNKENEWEDYQERYSSEAEAILGHQQAVDIYKAK